jgi:hypothetical protein
VCRLVITTFIAPVPPVAVVAVMMVAAVISVAILATIIRVPEMAYTAGEDVTD